MQTQKPMKKNKTPAEIRRTYYVKNRERILQHIKAYQQERKTEISAQKKAYYQAQKALKLSALDGNKKS